MTKIILSPKVSMIHLLTSSMNETILYWEHEANTPNLQRIPYREGTFEITNTHDSDVSRYLVTYYHPCLTKPQARVFNMNNHSFIADALITKVEKLLSLVYYV